MHLLVKNNYLFVSIIMFLILKCIKVSKSDEIKSPCEDPKIYATDRLINGSVRLYRGNKYWELYGMPDTVGYLKGPFDIWYESMAPVERGSAVMTAIQGEQSKSSFKFTKDKYWGWNSDGMLYIGGKDGMPMSYSPVGGFDVVFFNGKLDKPYMIAFKNIRVYYYLYSRGNWNIDGEKEGYIGGRNEENFPSDLTAGFTWPAENPKDGYIAYLFKKDKYCRRPEKLPDKKSCSEWRHNKELFGCLSESGGGVVGPNAAKAGPDSSKSNDSTVVPRNPLKDELKVDTTTKGSNSHKVVSHQSLAFVSFTIYLILSIY